MQDSHLFNHKSYKQWIHSVSKPKYKIKESIEPSRSWPTFHQECYEPIDCLFKPRGRRWFGFQIFYKKISLLKLFLKLF